MTTFTLSPDTLAMLQEERVEKAKFFKKLVADAHGKTLKADFGAEIPALQAITLDEYTGNGGFEEWSQWREQMCAYSNYFIRFADNQSWKSNWEQFLEAIQKRDLIDDEGFITLYRGQSPIEGLDVIEDGEHFSWTLDKRVAEWHSKTGRGGLKGFLITAKWFIDDLENSFIWATDAPEAEIMVNHNGVYNDGTWEIEVVDNDTSKDNLFEMLEREGKFWAE